MRSAISPRLAMRTLSNTRDQPRVTYRVTRSTTRASPYSTGEPLVTRMRETLPARGARIGLNTFIASIRQSRVAFGYLIADLHVRSRNWDPVTGTRHRPSAPVTAHRGCTASPPPVSGVGGRNGRVQRTGSRGRLPHATIWPPPFETRTCHAVTADTRFLLRPVSSSRSASLRTSAVVDAAAFDRSGSWPWLSSSGIQLRWPALRAPIHNRLRPIRKSSPSPRRQ